VRIRVSMPAIIDRAGRNFNVDEADGVSRRDSMAAWYYQGDGLRLWEETYAPFNLVPRPATAAAPQMAGWFRKKIATMADYKGLRMRIAPRSAVTSMSGRAARRS